MSRPRVQDHAVKLVDPDETHSELSPAEVSGDAETLASPGLRPEILADPAQQRTKALVHAALFKGTREAPTVGPYQVLKRIGAGGMGVVYAAYDDKLERKVALKLILGAAVQRPEARARTLREARALARLSHPNVVHVYQVGEVDDEIFVAMEFLTGPTLRAWLAAQPRRWQEVLAVFRQAGEGLAAAHRHGVIHRDFKPANVIVGDDGRVRVLDFGLAHFGGDDEAMGALPPAGEVTDVVLTQTGAVLGTPAYMAPEQFGGARGDAKTDQFGFCTALYEALYGQRPFAGDRLATLVSEVTAGRVQPPKSGHDVPAWLHRVVMRGLQPDPAARWPSMDALLAALAAPQSRLRPARIAAVVGSAWALLAGGVFYVYTQKSPEDPARTAEREAAARAQAEMIRSQNDKSLTEARAALTRDPVETIRALTKLAGDDPATRHTAQFLSTVAQVKGVPEQVLRAGRPLSAVRPLAGGFVGLDDLGAVWQWQQQSERTGTEVLPPGSATHLLAARDAPVWAVRHGGKIRVFADGREQTIDIAALETFTGDWRLASDGRTLVGVIHGEHWSGLGEIPYGVHLWDLTRPGSPPRTVALARGTLAVVAADASVVVTRTDTEVRVARLPAGTETAVKYRGTPWLMSGDRRFVLAWPADVREVLDVIDLETGTTRRVETPTAVTLGGSDALFVRPFFGETMIWRESLATGAVAWEMQVPMQAGAPAERLLVDPVGEQLALALGDQWALADPNRGGLTSFMTVPKDRKPQWAGPDTLMVSVGDELRLHRPSAAPVQVRERAFRCELAPGGRWAAVVPWGLGREFSRVELATRKSTRFRCPTNPSTKEHGDDFPSYNFVAVDDAGQIAMTGDDGWSCWWDEQHGARPAPTMPAPELLVALPRGVALATGTEVQTWSGPDDMTRRWTIASRALDLRPSPSGALLAARSDRGVQLLRDTGEVQSLIAEATPLGRDEVLASSLAWSPDGARLASLDPDGGSLRLTIWDVAGEPREVARHDLKDSPGRPRNLLAFTPSGAAVTLTDRHESLARLDLETRETQRLAAPDLFAFAMRSETELLGVDIESAPLIADIAAREVSPLTPHLGAGGSSRPTFARDANGSTWICATLGPGTLTEVAPATAPASL